MRVLYILLLFSIIIFFIALISLQQYNQYYSKNYIELERYVESILNYLHDTYNPDRVYLLDIDDRNGSIKVIFALIYNDSTFYPVRYHIDFFYPNYNFAEINPYTIKLNNCAIEKCRIIYPEEVVFNLGNLKPELKKYKILSKKIIFENGVWKVSLELENRFIVAELTPTGNLLYYLEK